MWLRSAPDSGEVYLSWSRLYPGPYTVRWRQSGSDVWEEARTARPFFTVSGLGNGRLHEFAVEAESLGVKLASPVVGETPRGRDDCVPGSVPLFCSRRGFTHYLAAVKGETGEPLCQRHPEAKTSPQLPNCRYRIDGGLVSLNRYLGGRFVPPSELPDTGLLRRVLRHTLWRRYDPARGGSPPRLLEVPHAEAGAVTGFAVVRRFILRDAPPGLQSRITCFDPTSGDGRGAVYVDGHDASAVTDGAMVLTWLLHRGWRVCGVDLPLEGANAIDRTSTLLGHDDLDRAVADDGQLLGDFLAPVAAVVDWLVGSMPAESASRPPLLVAGRSGGGVVSCLYGAMDPRVDVVVDIAACFPMSTMREPLPFDTTGEAGNHLESGYPPLAEQVPDVAWILAGGARANLHFYSMGDPCCGRYDHEHPWIRYLRARGAHDSRVRFRLGAEPVHGLTPAALGELDRFLSEALNSPSGTPRDGP